MSFEIPNPPARIVRCLVIAALALGWACPYNAAAEGPTKADVERDLALEVKLISGDGVQPGQPVRLEIHLKNTSKERIYPVVRPGDGSEMGWREPHVFYTARIDKGDGSWQEVPKAGIARCGLFNAQWQEDVVELWPGKSIELKDWLAPPEMALELQQPGKVRLHVHYRYRGGITGKDPKTGKTFDTGKMRGMPAFELVSKPVEFEVLRPLDVVVSVKKPLKANTPTRLSEILDVKLVNRSKGGIHVTAPTLSGDARLTFEIEADGAAPTLSEQDQPYGKKQLLNPGDEAAILGDAPLANGIDGTWEYPNPGKVELRAVYTTSTWKPGAAIKSEWLEVEVVE